MLPTSIIILEESTGTLLEPCMTSGKESFDLSLSVAHKLMEIVSLFAGPDMQLASYVAPILSNQQPEHIFVRKWINVIKEYIHH